MQGSAVVVVGRRLALAAEKQYRAECGIDR